MKYRARYIGLIFLANVIFFSATHATPKAINSMVIFSDSISDVGNTTVLLQSLKQQHDPAFLLVPLKAYLDRKIDVLATFSDSLAEQAKQIVNDYLDITAAPYLASLVDKYADVPVLPPPPYWQDRFSNGPVWNEYLAEILNLNMQDERQFDNRAFGGSWAATTDHSFTLWNLIIAPKKTLINLFNGKLVPPSFGLVTSAYFMEKPQANPDDVFFVLYGANDYLNMLQFADNYKPAVTKKYVDNVVNSIESNIEFVLQNGGNRIVVISLPNIGLAPRYLNHPDQEIMQRVSQLHNQLLEQRVVALQQRFNFADIIYVDINQTLQAILDSPQAYGFTDSRDACTNIRLDANERRAAELIPFENNIVLNSRAMRQSSDVNVCDNPDDYVFWDDLHPSSKAHQLLAQAIYNSMADQGFVL